jgi:hypothetical protein
MEAILAPALSNEFSARLHRAWDTEGSHMKVMLNGSGVDWMLSFLVENSGLAIVGTTLNLFFFQTSVVSYRLTINSSSAVKFEAKVELVELNIGIEESLNGIE